MESLIADVATRGILGLVIAILLMGIVIQDRRLATLHTQYQADLKKAYDDFQESLKEVSDGRIADAKAYNTLALDLQSKSMDTMHKIIAIFEALKQSRGRLGP